MFNSVYWFVAMKIDRFIKWKYYFIFLIISFRFLFFYWKHWEIELNSCMEATTLWNWRFSIDLKRMFLVIFNEQNLFFPLIYLKVSKKKQLSGCYFFLLCWPLYTMNYYEITSIRCSALISIKQRDSYFCVVRNLLGIRCGLYNGTVWFTTYHSPRDIWNSDIQKHQHRPLALDNWNIFAFKIQIAKFLTINNPFSSWWCLNQNTRCTATLRKCLYSFQWSYDLHNLNCIAYSIARSRGVHSVCCCSTHWQKKNDS